MVQNMLGWKPTKNLVNLSANKELYMHQGGHLITHPPVGGPKMQKKK